MDDFVASGKLRETLQIDQNFQIAPQHFEQPLNFYQERVKQISKLSSNISNDVNECIK